MCPSHGRMRPSHGAVSGPCAASGLGTAPLPLRRHSQRSPASNIGARPARRTRKPAAVRGIRAARALRPYFRPSARITSTLAGTRAHPPDRACAGIRIERARSHHSSQENIPSTDGTWPPHAGPPPWRVSTVPVDALRVTTATSALRSISELPERERDIVVGPPGNRFRAPEVAERVELRGTQDEIAGRHGDVVETAAWTSRAIAASMRPGTARVARLARARPSLHMVSRVRARRRARSLMPCDSARSRGPPQVAANQAVANGYYPRCQAGQGRVTRFAESCALIRRGRGRGG
jgi:hypothetical protein